MSWTSRIDPGLRLIYTRVSGALIFEDAVTHRTELAADPTFDATYRHLLDLRGVDRVELTTDEVIQLASRSALSAPSAQAIVAATDEMFGLSRMYYAYCSQRRDHEDIAVCRTLTDACLRLGIDRAQHGFE